MRLIALERKDVISMKTGEKLGFISDVEIDANCRFIEAIVVERFSLFKLICFFKGPPCLVIPIEQIVNIGEDVILVDVEC
jgi:YlmC/YmxH family sporulation protein